MTKYYPACVMALLIFLSGCAGSPAHNAFIAPGEIEKTLDYWKGKSIEEAINQYGPPNNVSDVSEKKYYGWEITSGRGLCKWWFKVNDRQLIEDSGSSGHVSQCYGAVAIK